MRRWHAQSLLAIACVLSCQPWLFAQVLLAVSNNETQSTKGCATPSESRPPGPEVRIAELTFEGDIRMPTAEQREIAASLTQRAYSGETDDVASDVLERVRRAWLDRGYFLVQVGGEAKVLTSGPASERITVSVRVDEGQQYRLESIQFKNNRAIRDSKVLRNLFPLADGDIFNRDKIAEGLEHLRSAYGNIGYINFTSIPNTEIDDDNQTISLIVDVDEGKQFFISEIDAVGTDDEVVKDSPLKPGDVYNKGVVNLIFQKHANPPFPDDSLDSHIQMRLNERAGTVAITFDFRDCPLQ
jgi:outer membrane protein insertion porin family